MICCEDEVKGSDLSKSMFRAFNGGRPNSMGREKRGSFL